MLSVRQARCLGSKPQVELYGGRTQEAAYRTVYVDRIGATIRVPKTPHGKGKGLRSDTESS